MSEQVAENEDAVNNENTSVVKNPGAIPKKRRAPRNNKRAVRSKRTVKVKEITSEVLGITADGTITLDTCLDIKRTSIRILRSWINLTVLKHLLTVLRTQ